MPTKLTGNPSLAYTGVNPSSPPNTTEHTRDPRTTDYYEFHTGDFWLNKGTTAAPVSRVWILTNKANHIATWVLFVNGGGNPVLGLQPDIGAVVNPLLGIINITNTDGNIVTSNGGANNLSLDFANSIVVNNNITSTAGNLYLADTNAAGTQGIIFFGGDRFISNLGTRNSFFGESAGNLTLTTANSQWNTGIGTLALNRLTTGTKNTALGVAACMGCQNGNFNVGVGIDALLADTSGSQNTCIGYQSAFRLATGSDNICIGNASAANYTVAESSNILLGHRGVNGESHVMRLGTTGGGAGQQTKCWIAAVRGVTTDVADAIPVLIDSTGQLGTISSSRRYKENIEEMGNFSSKILNLEPKLFNFKGKENKSWGLIAEEVEQVFPELVVYDNGQPETVKYHELLVLLLNELKRLTIKIKELENKILQKGKK